MSNYVAVNHKGKTYHLFNARKMPVGRIAMNISQFIRGKHKPSYNPQQYSDGDTCIVVNMENPLFTGRKSQQKLYRHHTGYPGGLKEYTYKTVLEKNPERIMKDAILGMLPKNKLRTDILKKHVVMFRGAYHTFHNVGLPQFTDAIQKDFNEELGFNDFSPEHNVITFTSAKDGSVPEEFKDVKQEIDHTISEPQYMKTKTHLQPKTNFKLA